MNWQAKWQAWVLRRSETTRLWMVFGIISFAPISALITILALLPD